MTRARASVFVVAALILGGHLASAQDLSRYRGYVLESSLESVVANSGARRTDVKTIHQRPATLQELEWRMPYGTPGSEPADPVRDIAFAFMNDSLYQIVVNYDRGRTDGLTNDDIIDTLTTAYGAPVTGAAKTRATRPAAARPDAIVVARWDTVAASVTLVRSSYTPDFQLILTSKTLSARAHTATREALRLDMVEAPRRESDQRKKDAAEVSATRERTRATNKAGFRP